MDNELASQAKERIDARLSSDRLSVGQRQELQLLAKLAASVGPRDPYTVTPPSLLQALEQSTWGQSASRRREMLYLLIQQAVRDQLESAALARLPPLSQQLQLIQLSRLADLPDQESDWLETDKDIFQKELGLATLRLHAAAAQLIDPRCGVPRSLAWGGSVTESAARAVLFGRLGGFRPFFQIHTHLSYLDRFDAEGWNDCYRVCAELFEVYPSCLGMFGASWFYDPAIKEISPRLSYLQDVPASGDARFLFMTDQGHFVQDAISTSPTRRSLYEAGTYKPRSFMMLWGRTAIQAWAQAHGSDNK